MEALYKRANILNIINVIVAFPVIPAFLFPIAFKAWVLISETMEVTDGDLLGIFFVDILAIYMFAPMVIELGLYSSAWILLLSAVCWQYTVYKVGDAKQKKKAFIFTSVMIGTVMLLAAVGMGISIGYGLVVKGFLVNAVLCFHVVLLGLPTVVYLIVKRKRILLGVDENISM